MAQPISASIEVFNEARDQFFSSVLAHDLKLFSKCASPAEFLADIQNLKVITTQKRRGTKFLRQITKLSNGLEQYFNVIEIIISSNSEYAAIGWGIFRLILQLAGNYVVFFEKLTRVFEQVAAALPQYQNILEIFGQKVPERLKSSLCEVCVDLFQFFQGVTRVFTTEDGRIKRTPSVIGSLFWKPFEARFNGLVERLKFHQEVLKDEITIHELQNAHDARAADVEERRRAAEAREVSASNHALTSKILESQRKEQFDGEMEKIKNWLSPPEFVREYEEARSQMEDDTAYWLFEVPKFIEWRSFDVSSAPPMRKGKLDGRAFWIKGNPGCGKTVLASSAISELHDTEEAEGSTPPLTLYFFFSQRTPDKSNQTSALRAILAQILRGCRQDSTIIDALSFSMGEATDGQLTASKSAYIVLDAIDECEDSADLIKTWQNICEDAATRLLLFSRPNVAGLRRLIGEEHRLDMDKRSVQSDIRTFLTRRIENLRDDCLLPSSTDTERLVQHLVDGAAGMFLWARLMISYLNSPGLTLGQRVKVIQDVSLPEGLEVMYQRIVNLIQRSDNA